MADADAVLTANAAAVTVAGAADAAAVVAAVAPAAAVVVTTVMGCTRRGLSAAGVGASCTCVACHNRGCRGRKGVGGHCQAPAQAEGEMPWCC